MAASIELNIILRDAAKTPLLTGERNCVHPGDDVRDSFTGSEERPLAASRKMAYNIMVRDARKNALLTMRMKVVARVKEAN
jgi:hypothetical protein